MASKSVVVRVPDGLAARGSALWLSLGQVAGTPAGDLALEACRTADRLDELDAVIAGKGVLNLLMFRLRLDLEDVVAEHPEVKIKIEVSNVLAEARQQGAALKNLLNELGLSRAGKKTGGSLAPTTGLALVSQSRQSGA